uniref:Uncharacterized protein n=1 Tax=Melopsittacus undulatus TaxID=13146 RepID=A0A8V5FM09_MELUD
LQGMATFAGLSAKVCPADSRARINCGFPGITAKECEKKGCCFRSHPAGVPWCFYHQPCGHCTFSKGK